jgi:hypothetical protein
MQLHISSNCLNWRQSKVEIQLFPDFFIEQQKGSSVYIAPYWAVVGCESFRRREKLKASEVWVGERRKQRFQIGDGGRKGEKRN